MNAKLPGTMYYLKKLCEKILFKACLSLAIFAAENDSENFKFKEKL